MANDEDDDALEAKKICYHCVGESFLNAEIKKDGKRRKCSYCDKHAKAYTIEEMSDRIEGVFEEHFVQVEDDWNGDDPLVIEAIENAAAIPEQAAIDIQTVLEDRHYDHEAAKMGEHSPFASDTCYREKGISDVMWQEEWRYFERSLKTEARFFSRTGAAHLSSVFGGIDKMKTRDGRPLVVDAGPSASLTALYRARVFQADDKLIEALCRPDQHLGSPPMIYANAGRMNARGISLFYGANTAEVAIAEVRPPVGSQVAVARFDIIRPLRLLDLTAVSDVSESGSIFDCTFSGRLERAAFLRSLSERMTKAVMPDDEAFEYLPTQAIADFLATENQPALDGIVFPSVQAGDDALNVVLFHKAARVQPLDIPKATKIDAITGRWNDEGWEIDYWVTEYVPPKKEKEDEAKPVPWSALIFEEPGKPDEDPTQPTLKIDLPSIKIHIVRKVQFDCEEHPVFRHRLDTEKPEF